jgi:hypothetical protein
MLTFFMGSEARKSASLCLDWRNTGSAILSGNTRKFESRLAPSEIALVEAVAGLQMQALGYAPVTSAAERARHQTVTPLQRAWYAVLNRLRQARVEARSMLNDKNFPLRLRKIGFVAWLRAKAWLRRICYKHENILEKRAA